MPLAGIATDPRAGEGHVISITGIGTYLPRLRLERRAIAQALGWLSPAAGGKGARTLAFWDEDSLTMAVAAARAGLGAAAPQVLAFATTTPPFAEPQNAALLRAALRLPETCRTRDATGTPRAGLAELHDLLEAGAPGLLAAADRPVALAGSAAESRQGDGAAAASVAPGPGLLTYLGGASLGAPFVHRSRASGAAAPLDWEERWQRDAGYLALVPRAIAAALDRAGLGAQAIDHFVLPCPIPGVAGAVAQAAGLSAARLAADLGDRCGDTGAPHALLMLAGALEHVRPGQILLVAQFGQGATALVLRAEAGAAGLTPLAAPLAAGIPEDNYLKLLAFQDRLDWDRGLRGRFTVQESFPTAWRNAEALLGFTASRDPATGEVRFPPDRGAPPWPLADRGGRVASATADLLAFSKHPPNCYGLVDLNGGGRLMMEFTDPDAARLGPGDRVDFTFRVKDIDTTSGFRRYFWKAVAAERGAAWPAD